MDKTEKIKRTRKLIVDTRRVFYELGMAEKAVQRVLQEAHELGFKIDEVGRVEKFNNDRKKAIGIISHHQISKFLTGGLRNITSFNVPKKYAIEYYDLVDIVENWIKRVTRKGIERRFRQKKRDMILKEAKKFVKR